MAISRDLMRKAQAKLNQDLGANLVVDGLWGRNTKKALTTYQKKHNLTIDSSLDYEDLLHMGLVNNEAITEPPSSKDFDVVFGRPTGRPDWEAANLGFCDISDFRENKLLEKAFVNETRARFNLPSINPHMRDHSINVSGYSHVVYPLSSTKAIDFFATRRNPYTGGRGYGFVVHNKVVDVYYELFKAWFECDLAKKMKTFGGSYNFRVIRGGKRLSSHSYGIAIDINMDEGRFGYKPHENLYELAVVARQLGFTWGGSWGRGRKQIVTFENGYQLPVGSGRGSDGMHFQYGF